MTKAARVSVRLPSWIQGELKRLAAGERRSLSAVVRDLLEEALRMRRCPGIVFVDGPTGRRPVLAGTGLEVWEVVKAYRDCGEDFEKLKETFDWLSPRQLRDALHYFTFAFTPKRLRRRSAAKRSSNPGPLNSIPTSSLDLNGQALPRRGHE
jgi:uncharacterized protein (DUF433 family)